MAREDWKIMFVLFSDRREESGIKEIHQIADIISMN